MSTAEQAAYEEKEMKTFVACLITLFALVVLAFVAHTKVLETKIYILESNLHQLQVELSEIPGEFKVTNGEHKGY
jgi:hypothetical protein